VDRGDPSGEHGGQEMPEDLHRVPRKCLKTLRL
jgi:hypothetical protein